MENNEQNIHEYIADLIPESKTIFKEMEEYAKKNHIPIISSESLQFLKILLLIKHPVNILEIGTAIGYSALNFCDILNGKCFIDTVEINEKRHKDAEMFISETPYKDNIKLHLSDISDFETEKEKKYDFIFLDAAKGQYKKLYQKFFDNLSVGGIFITDNVFFHGDTIQKSQLDVKRRNRTIYRRLNEYLKFLMIPDYTQKTAILDIGDGLTVTIKTSERYIYEEN